MGSLIIPSLITLAVSFLIVCWLLSVLSEMWAVAKNLTDYLKGK